MGVQPLMVEPNFVEVADRGEHESQAVLAEGLDPGGGTGGGGADTGQQSP